MTLQSRRKHQTTQQSIRQGNVSKSLLCVVCVLSVCWCTFFLAQALVAEESPLDRLRNRSAEKRWKSIRERVSNRREVRRERIEKRKSGTDASSEEVPIVLGETNSLKRIPQQISPSVSARPAVSSRIPIVEYQPIYREHFQLDRHQFCVPSLPEHSVMKGGARGERRNVDRANFSMPKIQPARFPHSTQTHAQPRIQALPVSDAKSVKTVLAPDLPAPVPADRRFPLNKIEADLIRMKTPIERGISTQSQGVYGQFDKIKPIGSIAPFVDYEPDQKLREEDPGRHLCFLDAVRPELVSNANVQCPQIEILPEAGKTPSRNFAHLNYAWKASNLHSYPLYFEDPNLERYGHIHRPLIQPAVSVARFNLQLLGLPYQMAMQPVAKCVYPLGHYRPGDVCSPKYYYQIPLNPRAILVTAGVYTGLFYIIP